MTHTIKIFYFPKAMRYSTVAILPAAAWLTYTGHWKWAIILVIIGAFILTAQYITTIDVANKKFIDAFSFFGMPFNTEQTTFKNLDKIVITKGNYSQKVNTRSSLRQYDWSDYTGTLIYDNRGTLDLLTHEDKKVLIEALRVYANALNVPIEDNSTVASRR